MLPTHILVPTDLSEGAEAALNYASELANKLGATVHLLNVISVPSLGIPELGVAITSSMIETMVADGQQSIDKLADARRGSVTIGHVLLKVGNPTDMILEAAKEVHADLIVMGTHGRHGLARAFLGSVAETVVRSAPCAVLAIHSGDGVPKVA